MMKKILFTFTFIIYTYLSTISSHTTGSKNKRYVKPTATKGLVIDAGSGGSRLHVYTWKARLFTDIPPPLSYPEGNEQWTARMSPGISTYANNFDMIPSHLEPLIKFAKDTLIQYKDQYQDLPIYFYATGGMRELEYEKRDELIDYVRKYLSNKALCPFYFQDDFARIISGEEEAIFSWAATNFLMGTLLPASKGLGIVTDVNNTYGTLDLGGASAQIAYFLPSQDILEGLYKFQLGSQKQWNVYTKSFLQFGVNSARIRHFNELINEYVDSNNHHHKSTPKLTKENIQQSIVNPCFHASYSELVQDNTNKMNIYTMIGPELPHANQLDLCLNSLKPLLEKQSNLFCNQVYHGDCSIAGAYQPPLPNGNYGNFIGTSSYMLIWRFLKLPSTSSLDVIKAKANMICQMNYDGILFYYEVNSFALQEKANHFQESLPYFCFLTSYIIVLLEDGYKFQNNQTITVLDEVHGNKVGWALGAILYEINELPWEFLESDALYYSWRFLLLIGFIGFLIGGMAAIFIYRNAIYNPKYMGNTLSTASTDDIITQRPEYYNHYMNFKPNLTNSNNKYDNINEEENGLLPKYNISNKQDNQYYNSYPTSTNNNHYNNSSYNNNINNNSRKTSNIIKASKELSDHKVKDQDQYDYDNLSYSQDSSNPSSSYNNINNNPLEDTYINNNMISSSYNSSSSSSSGESHDKHGWFTSGINRANN